jgi:predicted permease
MYDRFIMLMRALVRKNRIEQELDEELRYHVDKDIERNIGRGMSPEAARRVALREFGGMEQVKEQSRDARGVRLVEDIVRDVSYGIRVLRRSPGFALAVVMTLALGIGANTAIFSVVDSVLLRPLPFNDPGSLLWLTKSAPRELFDAVNDTELAAWQAGSHTMAGIEGWVDDDQNMTGFGEPARVNCGLVSAGLLSLLGVKPVIGRDHSEDPGEAGRLGVVMLGENFWRSRFGGSQSVLGSSVILDDKTYTVVGVAPSSLDVLDRFDVLLPLPDAVQALNQSHPDSALLVNVVGRIKPGMTASSAAADLDSILERSPDLAMGDERLRAKVVSLSEYLLGNTRAPLLILLGAVGFVLLIASANVANLMLARTASRQAEIAVRAALGARRWRLIRQLLVESVTLSMIGGVVGILLAGLGTKALAAGLPQSIADSLRGAAAAAIDARVLTFTLLVSVSTGILFGFVPAIAGSSVDLNHSLKCGARKMKSAVGLRSIRGPLVVGEIALSLILLTGACLMIESFGRLRAVNVGFNAENVLTLQVMLPASRYGNLDQVRLFSGLVLDRVRSLGGVRSAAMTNSLPLGGIWLASSMVVEGEPVEPGQRPRPIPVGVVSSDYFSALGIQLVKGRVFNGRDRVEGIGLAPEQRPEPPGVAIVNEAFVRTYWPDQDPIGKHVGDREVIGVVGDYKQQDVASEMAPEVFWNGLERSLTLAARTDSDPRAMIPAVRAQIESVDPAQPVSSIKTMNDYMAASVAEPRFYTLALASFALMSLLLAAVGIYGVISYSVVAGTHEIGLRMALGATGRGVLRTVIGRGMLLIVTGLVSGLAGALALTRLISSCLYGVGPRDVATLISITIILGVVALLACCIPAWRAARLDPLAVLRYE